MPCDHGEGWFTAAEAARIAGLSSAMLNYLCRTGLVEPTCHCKRGHGSKRHYSFGDIVALRLVGKLSHAGISVLRLKASLHKLRLVHPEITLSAFPSSHIVTNGRDLFLRTSGTPVERLLDGQLAFAFVVELTELHHEVVQGIEKLKSA